MDILRYVAALWRHWRAYLTGSSVVAVLSWATLYGRQVSPGVVFVALVAGVPVAGFFAWRELYRARTVAIEGLEQLRAEGSEMRFEPVTTTEQFTQWKEHHQEWSNRTAQYLGEKVGIVERSQFANLSTLTGNTVSDSFDAVHSSQRNLLGHRLQILEKIIDRASAFKK